MPGSITAWQHGNQKRGVATQSARKQCGVAATKPRAGLCSRSARAGMDFPARFWAAESGVMQKCRELRGKFRLLLHFRLYIHEQIFL